MKKFIGPISKVLTEQGGKFSDDARRLQRTKP